MVTANAVHVGSSAAANLHLNTSASAHRAILAQRAVRRSLIMLETVHNDVHVLGHNADSVGLALAQLIAAILHLNHLIAHGNH